MENEDAPEHLRDTGCPGIQPLDPLNPIPTVSSMIYTKSGHIASRRVSDFTLMGLRQDTKRLNSLGEEEPPIIAPISLPTVPLDCDSLSSSNPGELSTTPSTPEVNKPAHKGVRRLAQKAKNTWQKSRQIIKGIGLKDGAGGAGGVGGGAQDKFEAESDSSYRSRSSQTFSAGSSEFPTSKSSPSAHWASSSSNSRPCQIAESTTNENLRFSSSTGTTQSSQVCAIWYIVTSWRGNLFPITGPSCEESVVCHWIPLTKANNTRLDIL